MSGEGQAATPAETGADSQAWRDRDQPAVTLRDMVLDHDRRIFMIERFTARAEPVLFDPERGMVAIVQELVDARNEREAQMRLIRWAATFAGAGLIVTIGNAILQATGVLK